MRDGTGPRAPTSAFSHPEETIEEEDAVCDLIVRFVTIQLMLFPFLEPVNTEGK